ncbi:hypothetical protein KSF78_0002740 [Schistosoma japonicum]|nr:hypothetical protein KSF78_0002740 [Schistosoma japonicum]
MIIIVNGVIIKQIDQMNNHKIIGKQFHHQKL